MECKNEMYDKYAQYFKLLINILISSWINKNKYDR